MFEVNFLKTRNFGMAHLYLKSDQRGLAHLYLKATI